MSPIPSLSSKLSMGFFKGSKKTTAAPLAATSTNVRAADTSAHQSSKPAPSCFDAAAPRPKTFRKLSAEVTTAQNASAASTSRVGLPSVDELAKKHSHTAPSMSAAVGSGKELTLAQRKKLPQHEQEAYYAWELANDKTPVTRSVSLFLEPVPEDLQFDLPKTFIVPKSILKKTPTLNVNVEDLPTLSRTPPATPGSSRRPSLAKTEDSETGFGSRTLSRTVSFDHQTQKHQAKLESLQEERDLVASHKRELARKAKESARRPNW